jgi:dienelactone hydrolase
MIFITNKGIIMKKYFIYLFFSTTVLGQGVTKLDTLYTPADFSLGDLYATIFIPSPSNAKGVGIVVCRGMFQTRLSEFGVWCDSLAANGYLAMTIDYPDINASDGAYPNPVRAFKTAVEFLRINADRFELTTGKIVGLGASQGALVWGQTIIWDNDDTYFGTDSLTDDHLDAAILLYGAYDLFHDISSSDLGFLDTYFSSNPPLRSTKGQCITNTANITTPLLLLHGVNDNAIYVAQSRNLRDSVLAHGGVCELLEYNGSHGFDHKSGQFTTLGLQAKDDVLAFLDQTVTGLEERTKSLPTDFYLNQNYPNPFNPTTKIRYQVPATGLVSLRVYNLLGEVVTTLVNEERPVGSYEVEFNAANLPSGVYFYQLQTGNFVETKKMVLLR